MSKTIVYALLNLTGLILFITWGITLIREFIKTPSKLAFFSWPRFRYPVMVSFIVGIPYLLVNYTPLPEILNWKTNAAPLINLLLAVLISGIWMIYIVRLDIFEQESWKNILFVFLAAIGTTYLCDILYPLIHLTGLVHTEAPFSDFLYCVFGIGLIEESVKIIPVLLLLRFTKAINEPFDYLLYASIAALGFACAENIRYFNNYGLEIIGARTFYAAVAHMTFSSTIAYGMALQRYRYTKIPAIITFIFFFGIAIFAHGFYDFWLINPTVAEYSGITTLFFIITLHLWFVMKNNTLNISNFYDPNKKINNEELGHYLVISLCGMYMLSYTIIGFAYSAEEANSYFFYSIQVYGYVLFYLIAGFSRFQLIQGYLAPLRIPFDFIIPKFRTRNKSSI